VSAQPVDRRDLTAAPALGERQLGVQVDDPPFLGASLGAQIAPGGVAQPAFAQGGGEHAQLGVTRRLEDAAPLALVERDVADRAVLEGQGQAMVVDDLDVRDGDQRRSAIRSRRCRLRLCRRQAGWRSMLAPRPSGRGGAATSSSGSTFEAAQTSTPTRSPVSSS